MREKDARVLLLNNLQHTILTVIPRRVKDPTWESHKEEQLFSDNGFFDKGIATAPNTRVVCFAMTICKTDTDNDQVCYPSL